MSRARSYLGVTTIASNSKIYAIGGYNNRTYFSTVEEATIPETVGFYNPQWTSDTQHRTSYDITSLIPKDTYRINVSDAYDPDGMRIAPFSNTTFIVDYAGSFSKNTPINSATNQALNASLSWNPSAGATGYEYCYDTSNINPCNGKAWTATAGTSVGLSGLNPNTTYYWQVRATNPGGATNANGGTWWSFTTHPNTYTLIYAAGAHGSLTGASLRTVNHGASGAEVVAVPDTGYHFVSWSDGVLTASRMDTNVIGNIAITANFAINTYTLTYTAGAHGAISGTSPQTVNHGASGTVVVAVPDTGYHFVSWSDNSTANPRTDTRRHR